MAELCLGEVFDGWLGELTRRWGDPGCPMTVLGMGKLGGGELNFSSDVDLIFIYEADGWLNANFSRAEFFRRLGERLAQTLAARHPAGELFRPDLRLRPEGDSGALARSLESAENYYAAQGEVWERMAMIKARGVAGDTELGYEFEQRLQPFVYPRYLSHEILDETARLKQRMETELLRLDEREREIKRGRGGIREVEFVVQSLQLLNGAKHTFLQEKNTPKTLAALRSLIAHEPLLPAEDVATLQAAYAHLRTVEHRIMIAEEKQTHLLPEGENLARLALSLGHGDAAEFLTELKITQDGVREVFARHFASQESADEVSIETEPLVVFADPAAAERLLDSLAQGRTAAGVSHRARRIFATLRPRLFERLAASAYPDRVLSAFARFVEAYGIRATLFELLMQNPRLLELLVSLFDASEFFTDVAIRRPQLIDEIARAGDLDDALEVADYLARFKSTHDAKPQRDRRDWLRIFSRSLHLRIVIREALGLADFDSLMAENTALAEATLRECAKRFAPELTIIALGKFGAGEITYGSDLDLVFVGDPSLAKSASALLRAITAHTAEGTLAEIDLRLRPDGASGLLVEPLAAFERYFEKRAQLWEAQAITRARAIVGPDGPAFIALAREHWQRAGERPDLREKVAAMLTRIHSEKGADDHRAFKSGRGGMVAVEFLVQMLQMRHDIWENSTNHAIALLGQAGVFSASEATDLHAAYRFLRKIETELRRQKNRSVDKLPRGEEKMAALAKRLDFATPDDFLTQYTGKRKKILEICKKFI